MLTLLPAEIMMSRKFSLGAAILFFFPWKLKVPVKTNIVVFPDFFTGGIFFSRTHFSFFSRPLFFLHGPYFGVFFTILGAFGANFFTDTFTSRVERWKFSRAIFYSRALSLDFFHGWLLDFHKNKHWAAPPLIQKTIWFWKWWEHKFVWILRQNKRVHE